MVIDQNNIKLTRGDLNMIDLLNTFRSLSNCINNSNNYNAHKMKTPIFLNVSFTLIFVALFLHSRAQVPENGLVFDGNDDYVLVPSSAGDEFNPEFNLTVECWVYLNEAASPNHRPHLITKYYSYGLAVDTTGEARMFYYTDEWDLISSTTIINPNQWYHLAATFDGSIGRLYVNGVEEGSIVLNDTLNQNYNDVRLGAVNDVPANDNLNGMLDEARIWNVTRTGAQIQDNMNMMIPGNTSGLVGYWRFDEGYGTNADCETPYDNDGTLTNMSTPSAWQTSTAPVGETSIFAESSDITETSACDVDVDFRSSPEGPGTGYSMAVMQVNELPNSLAGLHADKASQYWEIWSEDPDFDGNFTADVRFHYDDINGLPTEPSLELFRRNNAAGTWSPASGYSVISNDGGSSSNNDGIGYIELTITEATTGGFAGQYIISWVNAPVIDDIPDQSVPEGSAFATINLDDYVSDPDDADSEISWTVSGEENVSVTITGRVATITANDPDWNGSDMVTFTAEDPDGATDSEDVTFEVTPVNDPPVMGDIPDQETAEGDSFSAINLDDFVTDIDNDITTMTWTVSDVSNLTVDITDRVAIISINDADWNGSDTLVFTATDTSGAMDMDTSIFTVTGVNDPPTVNKVIPDTSFDANSFFTFVLDPNTFADADPEDELELTASLLNGGTFPDWLVFEASPGTFTGMPADADSGAVEVVVTATDDSAASVSDTFTIRVISYVGISNLLESLEIRLYPNPNNGRFVIESDRVELKGLVLEIFDEKGQLVWNREIREQIGTWHESVTLENAAEGIYLLRVRNKHGMVNKRFVIGQ